MYTGDTLCHSSTCEVNAEARHAFSYLSDGVLQGEWTLGSQQRECIGDNLFKGLSIFDGGPLYVRIDADPDKLIILYHIGSDDADLQPRNMIRILPGPVIGKTDEQCLVTLLSWRDAAMPDDKWKLKCVSHETEMYIVKNRIEQRAKNSVDTSG